MFDPPPGKFLGGHLTPDPTVPAPLLTYVLYVHVVFCLKDFTISRIVTTDGALIRCF